jgi:hypothetical protein
MASEPANCCEWPMGGAGCRNGRRLAIVKVVEGLVDHYLLNLHHVRPGPNQAAYDIAFLVFGALLAIGGFAWYERTTASARASAAEPDPQ